MNPCDEPHMPGAAWRAFVASHPEWKAPPIAPCGGAAVGTWLRRAAIGFGAVAGAGAVGAGIAPVIATAAWGSVRPIAFAAVAWAPGTEPDRLDIGITIDAGEPAKAWCGACLEKQFGVENVA